MKAVFAVALHMSLADATPGPVAQNCVAGAEKYWANDKPNNECAETCLNSQAQRVEFWVLTVGKGHAARNETAPCADHGFHSFNRTDVIGAGPLKIQMDKYVPDGPGARLF